MDRGLGFRTNQRQRSHSVHLEKYCLPIRYPWTIISDNGPQLDSRVYRNFCHELKIKNLYSTPRYPQSNGQAKASNKTLLTALKKRLDVAKGKWVDELPGVLWAYRNIIGRPTGISLFALTYGMEVIIPTKIGMPTLLTDMPEQ